MAQPARDYFLDLSQAASQVLDQVTSERLDFGEQRTIWELHGVYRGTSVHLKEVFNRSGRMYAYYVVQQGQILAGFDNYPDQRALSLKYGSDFKLHLNSLLPHRHGKAKASLTLTVEMDVPAFLQQLPVIVSELY